MGLDVLSAAGWDNDVKVGAVLSLYHTQRSLLNTKTASEGESDAGQA